ncbi:MAG: zinc-binding dehydrogenase [Actinobacteria bacterium]|nr:zinc-binding dehydrogenase [Actinomycetota bacterium]
MKAAVLERLGEPGRFIMREVPDPAPAPGEVVVEIDAASLNARDAWIAATPGRVELPAILGSDACGRIVDLGRNVEGAARGDRVLVYPALYWGTAEDTPAPEWEILGVPHQGTFAERIALPVENVRPAPARLDNFEAAALPLAALTAWRALVTRGRVAPGQTVLITGAGSGVATFLVQMAVTQGARVLVTSSTTEKIDRSRALGAESGVLYTDKEWPEKVGPVDLVVDSAGAPTLEVVFRCLRPGGTYVNFGDTIAGEAHFDVGDLYWYQYNVLGSTMGSPHDFDVMLEHVTGAEWRPVIDSVYPLEELGDAFRRLRAGDRFGKVVVTVG